MGSNVVLIETYWNVKVEYVIISNNDSSINRNILECKRRCSGLFKKFVFSINRNILECKTGNKYVYQNRTKVLIETYWNVKDGVLSISRLPIKY